ncbi:hypothetical protein TWF696_006982 [Orbilia brochopaga]|uniref:Glycolipid transfer protein domain-containing protein n=1 Tax=Orbilia brochopaga TaxID=3140254 RepID=A0AAV9UU48_9PEZI
MAESSSAAEPKTWFDGLKRPWQKVSTTPGINTTEFLEASESLVTLFDLLGAATFSPVTSDMNGNIKKVRDRYEASPAVSGTLQELVDHESKEKGNKATATQGLLWLLRGLDFTAKALRHNVNNPEEELTTSFQHSYDATLKKHHNFVVKGIFTVALKATPYRAVFYEKLGGSPTLIKKQLGPWLESMEEVVAIMQKNYADNKDYGF